MRRRFARRGMTLLELVVALTISAMAAVLGYSAVSTLSDRRERSESLTRALQASTNLRRELREWIGAAVTDDARSAPSFRGRHRIQDSGPDDELEFITVARTPLPASRTVVTLHIQRDSAGRPLGLAATFRDPRSGRSRSMLLAPDVRGFDARYVPSFLADSAMLSTWSSRTILPLAVELQFTVDAESPAIAGMPLVIPLRAMQ